jgi:hypothetical protein
MSPARQFILFLVAGMMTMTGWAQAVPPAPAKPFPLTANIMPPLPTPQSPVNFFRQLLMMPPMERNNSLTNRTPEARARILAKVREYQQLEPDERELRLRATELRWYLTPLLRLAPEDRATQLARVPKELSDLVKSRLTEWDLLPPPLQVEFLANDKTLHYFAQAEAPSRANSQQQEIADQFQKFLDLKPAEKKKLLGTLSETERGQMEKTLRTFDQLPFQQRALCIRNYAKFAGMSPSERAEFLRNAEHWSNLSPEERQTWRDLVAHVPLWPPIPQAIPPMPPLPPTAAPKSAKTGMATN